MSAFSKWLESVHTAKDVTYWIIQRLTEWRSSEPFSRPHSDMPGLLQAITATFKAASLSNGPVFKKLTSSSLVDALPVSNGPPLSLSNCWDLHGIFGITATRSRSISKQLRTSLVVKRRCSPFARNMPSVGPVSHAETGASSDALFSPPCRAHCTA